MALKVWSLPCKLAASLSENGATSKISTAACNLKSSKILVHGFANHLRAKALMAEEVSIESPDCPDQAKRKAVQDNKDPNGLPRDSECKSRCASGAQMPLGLVGTLWTCLLCQPKAAILPSKEHPTAPDHGARTPWIRCKSWSVSVLWQRRCRNGHQLADPSCQTAKRTTKPQLPTPKTFVQLLLREPTPPGQQKEVRRKTCPRQLLRRFTLVDDAPPSEPSSHSGRNIRCAVNVGVLHRAYYVKAPESNVVASSAPVHKMLKRVSS